MKFFEDSKYYSLKKSTYINLRWIGIIGQLISVYLVHFYFGFKFDFFLANLAIFFGVLSNLYLIFIYKKTQLSDKFALLFLLFDIIQLTVLIYLTGGAKNPFITFIIIPSIFASTNLGLKTNLFIVLITCIMIIFLTFYASELPYPLANHFHISDYIYYSIPVSLIIALIFLNYFAIIFGRESRLRKEALNKMEEIMAKEHEMLSLGGQAAAAAHSLGTPLSTIKIISQELKHQLRDRAELTSDIELLSSQVERCNQILKRLSLNPIEEDDFNFISLNSGSGLRSVIEFDLGIIDSLSRNELFKNSNLVLDVENSNLNEDDEFYIIVSALQDSIQNWGFSTPFVENEEELETISSDANFIISRKIEDNQVRIPIQAFLQGYKNGLFQHNELMLYSAPVNSPFDKVRLNLNAIEVMYVEP